MDSGEYVTTTEEVRDFIFKTVWSVADFDRWLAKHDCDVKAEAYDEALQDAEVLPMLRNPYREETE